MFSLIGNACCQPQECIHAQTNGSPILTRLLDIAGIITLIVLGALAASGMGGDVVNSLNTVSNLPIGGWIMIGGGVLASIIVTLQPERKIVQEFDQVE